MINKTGFQDEVDRNYCKGVSISAGDDTKVSEKKGATEIVEGTYFGITEEDYNFFSILSRTSATPLSTFLAVTRSNIFVSNLQQKE